MEGEPRARDVDLLSHFRVRHVAASTMGAVPRAFGCEWIDARFERNAFHFERSASRNERIAFRIERTASRIE